MLVSQKVKINKMTYKIGFTGMTSIKCMVSKMTISAKDSIRGQDKKQEYDDEVELYIVLDSKDHIDSIESISYSNDSLRINGKFYKIYDIDISYAYAGFEDEFSYYGINSTNAIKKLLREALVSYIVKQTGG